MMMKELFKTTLPAEESQIEYAVHFENEVYQFQAEGSAEAAIRIYREHDEWKSETQLPENTFRAATDALDSFLLSQH